MRQALVAVTGMGCVCGSHTSLPALMRVLHGPRQAPLHVDRASATAHGASPLFALPDDLAADLTYTGGTLTVGMALMAAHEALHQAGLEMASLHPATTGICLGSSSGASLNFFEYYSAKRKGRDADPAEFARSLNYNPGPALARALLRDAKLPFDSGPLAFTITNACTSGADAIGMGLSLLRRGICDVVLTGGSDELCATAITGFSRLLILDPELCRPFDASRNGLNLGEGAGILVLERLEHAQKRGYTPLALIGGYGTAADAHHLTAPHPQGRGLLAAVNVALDDAGIAPEDLAFINAHGTGTHENDKTEAHVFAAHFPHTLLSATKGATGHTLGAAGAIEAAITIACLCEGILPPSPGFTMPNPDFGVSPVSRQVSFTGKHALSQSLAFGGNNSALIFSRTAS